MNFRRLSEFKGSSDLDLEIMDLEIEIEAITLEIEIDEINNEVVIFVNDLIQCNFCDKTFSAISTLKLHREIAHDSQNCEFDIDNERVVSVSNPLNCVVCFKRFSAISTLILHHEIQHEDQFEQICTYEMRQTTSKNQQCDICNNISAKQSYPKKHTKPHTGEGCICNICPNIFATKTSPKHHTKFHTGERCKDNFSHELILISNWKQLWDQSLDIFWKHKLLQNLDGQNSVFQVF